MSRQLELSTRKTKELLELYADLMEEMRQRGILRTSNNPVADYAELIATKNLKLVRCGKEEKGCDATDSRENRYQIKGRRLTSHNLSRQLSVIRDINKAPFDYLIAVIFNERFDILEIWQIPFSFVKANSHYSKRQNGHIFIADKKLLAHGQGVLRIV